MPPSRPPSLPPGSRPPVVAVACPSCGGVVAGVDLGRRVECRYCGTDLHLPTLDFRPAPPPLPGEDISVPATPEARREYGVSIAIVALVVTAIIAIVYFGAHEERRDTARTRVAPRVPCVIECGAVCPDLPESRRVMQQRCDTCKAQCEAAQR